MIKRSVQKDKTVYTHAQALEALKEYCAYQDRCHADARQKLRELNIWGDEAEAVIADLIGEKYLDELRFAQSFARGKFKIKRWGRMKITRELKQRHISAYCIKKALREIPDEDYMTTLYNELERRDRLEKRGLHPYLKRRKLADYMFQRGYESNLTWEAIEELGL